ncbi:MAG: hypothetical protein E5V88_32200, partial [Mesorhizobium sp.]
TAYRQEAIACAAAMADGPKRPRDLKELSPRAASILLHNYYGWFARAERGIYALTEAGVAAVQSQGRAIAYSSASPLSVRYADTYPPFHGGEER